MAQNLKSPLYRKARNRSIPQQAVIDPDLSAYATEAYVDAADAAEAAARAAADNLRVLKAGDTMTGPLVLSGAPTINLHAATKKYVDDTVAGGGGSVPPYVPHALLGGI